MGVHTQRTTKRLKELNYPFGIVEKWVRIPNLPGGGKKIDLFGIIDIIALTPTGVMGLQSCGPDFSAHFKTITVDKRIESLRWLSTPGTSLELWGWRKLLKKKGGKQKIWVPRIHVFTLDDFKEEELCTQKTQ
jgi:hypothetical protein